MARKLFGISHLMLVKCETPKYGNLGCNFKHVIKFVSFHKLVTNTEMKWTVSEMGKDERNNEIGKTENYTKIFRQYLVRFCCFHLVFQTKNKKIITSNSIYYLYFCYHYFFVGFFFSFLHLFLCVAMKIKPK